MIRALLTPACGLLAAVACLFSGNTAQGQNITLLGQTNPVIGSISFGDVWGENNIACMGVWLNYSQRQFGVGIFDISNPSTPVRLSTYFYASAPNDNQFEQGILRDKIGYFASWSGGGLHIVSLTNPAAPFLLSRITTAENGFARVHTMFLERNFLYEAAHDNNEERVKVFDVSDPFSPVFLWDIQTTNTLKVHQITVSAKGSQTILYTSGWGNNGGTSGTPGQTDIWDVSAVGTSAPQWLGRIYSGQSSHSSWPTPDGNALVVCREIAGGEVTIYDISNPASPFPLSVIRPASMGLENDLPHNPVVVSNLLFLSWYQNGIQIFDISDRTRPIRTGAYDTYPGARTGTFQGNWGVYPFLGMNKLLLSDIQTGLYIMDASAVLTATNNYPPLLVQSPASLTATQNLSAALSSIVTGSSLSYRWFFQGSLLPGATNDTIHFSSVKGANSGSYFVIASNTHGSVTSAPATLSVVVNSNLLPSITAQPQSLSRYAEASATFSVGVTGDGPFGYRWLFNGSDIPDATNNSYTRPSVVGAHVGFYSVVVSNSYGSVTSSNALLTIIDSPYINGLRFAAGLRDAVISWNTTLPTDGRVDFGPTLAGGITGSSFTEQTLSTNHSVFLTGLAPLTTYSFQIVSKAGGSNYYSAVYGFTTSIAPLILDNLDTNNGVSFIGSWAMSVNVAGYYGANYQPASRTIGSPTRFATFRPNLSQAGTYNIDIWYPASGDRSTNAPFTVSSASGSVVIPVNQSINGSQWFRLASGHNFSMGTNGFVQLANNAAPSGSSVIADAVRFTAVDNTPGDTSIPPWWSAFHFGGPTDPESDPDNDGFTTGQEYILGTSPVLATQGLDVQVFRSGSSANLIFWPLLAGRSYTLQQRADLAGATWQTLPRGTISPGVNGEGVFTLSLTNTAQNFYKIAVQLDSTSPASLGASKQTQSVGLRPFAGIDAEPGCGISRVFVE